MYCSLHEIYSEIATTVFAEELYTQRIQTSAFTADALCSGIATMELCTEISQSLSAYIHKSVS